MASENPTPVASMFANTYIFSFTVYSGVLLFSARHLANIINVRLRTVHSRDRHSIYRARARYLVQWIWLDTVHTNTRTVHITMDMVRYRAHEYAHGTYHRASMIT